MSLKRSTKASIFVVDEAMYDGELEFKEGDVIEVVEKVSEEWWHGRLEGRAGMFATTYVEEV